jgi:8-amino-7-oxononanoate synthase
LAANRAKHQSALIATDGVFSMDGDLAPLSDLSTLAQRFDVWLLADDARGLGAATLRDRVPGSFAP